MLKTHKIVVAVDTHQSLAVNEALDLVFHVED